MTHDELLDIIKNHQNAQYEPNTKDVTAWDILQTIVELHKPEHSFTGYRCTHCTLEVTYPCPTIQAIEKELQ